MDENFSDINTWNKVIYTAGNKNFIVSRTEDGYVKISGADDLATRMQNAPLFKECREISVIEKERKQRIKEKECDRV